MAARRGLRGRISLSIRLQLLFSLRALQTCKTTELSPNTPPIACSIPLRRISSAHAADGGGGAAQGSTPSLTHPPLSLSLCLPHCSRACPRRSPSRPARGASRDTPSPPRRSVGLASSFSSQHSFAALVIRFSSRRSVTVPTQSKVRLCQGAKAC